MQARVASDSPRRWRRGRGACLPDRLGNRFPASAQIGLRRRTPLTPHTVIPQLHLRSAKIRPLPCPPPSKARALFPHARFIALGNRWKNKIKIHGRKKIQAQRWATFALLCGVLGRRRFWLRHTGPRPIIAPMSRLRRLVISNRWFFVTCRILPRRGRLTYSEFACLAQVIRERRQEHGFLLSAWVFLPDHWHAIFYPAHPLTISRVMESIKDAATKRINRSGTGNGNAVATSLPLIAPSGR